MKIGSTLKGIGPTYMDKTGRNGLRVGDAELPDYMERYQALKNKHLKLLAGYDFEPPFDLDENETLWLAAVERLIGMQIADSDVMIQEAIKTGKRHLS